MICFFDRHTGLCRISKMLYVLIQPSNFNKLDYREVMKKKNYYSLESGSEMSQTKIVSLTTLFMLAKRHMCFSLWNVMTQRPYLDEGFLSESSETCR